MKKLQGVHSGQRNGRIDKGVVILALLLVLPILSAFSFIYLCKTVFCGQDNLSGKEVSLQTVRDVGESNFVKEGEVIFFSKKNKAQIVQIDIEIADTPHELDTGLMHRRSLPNTAGMLFIFDRSQLLFFWMKNTYIPLDIIFVDENMRIVRIQKNSKPLSEELIPSLTKARYVVEVNAGFCDQHSIEIGDYIKYDKISHGRHQLNSRKLSLNWMIILSRE
jgi:uncharacterized membrane protein (UPF0127 family)